ncbi:hypothetical protein D3C83_284630 [compost metagenome]
MHKNDLRAGDHWVEWKLIQHEKQTTLQRTIFFSPHGLPGFIHWYLQALFFIMPLGEVKKLLER